MASQSKGAVGAEYKLHGDVDRDGDEDLFLFTGSRFEVWLNDGTGAFSFVFQRAYSPSLGLAGLAGWRRNRPL